MTDHKTSTPQPKIVKEAPFTIEVPGARKRDGETIPRRNHRSKNGLVSTLHPSIFTVWDIVCSSSKRYGDGKATGKRKLIRIHEETKNIKKKIEGKEQDVEKKWQYCELSPYEFCSFTEHKTNALRVGYGFRALGMAAGDRVHLYAATHPHWLLTAHGAASQSLPIVTAYDTLGEEGLKHSLLQTQAKSIFLDPHLLTKLFEPLKEAKSIQNIIYNDDNAPPFAAEPEKTRADIEKLKDVHPWLTVISFSELLRKGEKNPVDPVPPKAEDLCCIMYTSGSTGTPKGVLLTHKNVVAAIAGADTVVGEFLGPGDGLLAYLPLAHILEFVFETACIFWGGTLGYGHPKTISDNSVRNCRGDIVEFKPTVLVGVPAVWETVKKGILAKVSKMNPIVKNIFWGSLSAKSFMMENAGYLPFASLGTSLIDTIVFSKMRDATGGKLRFCMNGGGPIAKETQRFISMCIAPMIGGYGLTETSGMGALQDPLAWTDTALGEVPGGVEVKLVDFPDAGYYCTNKPPQGEIWIRGDSVASGYLDLKEETKESFREGWFLTGDIGEFDASGNLRIIDRKKNLVKTLNGEYIALEKLESIYRSIAIVSNVCVFVAEGRNKPIAIVVPNEPALGDLAVNYGIHGLTLEELCHNTTLNRLVVDEMQACGRKGGLGGIELIEGVVLSKEEWTPENGLVTPSQKLHRKNIVEKYKVQIKIAYDD
jgi:long-chain acyl-CoA synthetase